MSTSHQHKQNLFASNILYTSLVVSLLLTSVDILVAPMNSGARSHLVGSMLFLHLLDGLLFTLIRLGRRWAKFLLLIVVAFTVVATIVALITGKWGGATEGLQNNILVFAKQVLTSAAGVWALKVLFLKSSLPEELLPAQQ